MVKISDLLGKSVISLADALNAGYVVNVWFDEKLNRAKTAEIVSDEDELCERVYVPVNKTQCDGDAVIIKSLEDLSTQKPCNLVPCPINRECYNQSGKKLGKVRDVTMENCAVINIICDGGEFTPKELLTLGEKMCIFNDSGVPIKLRPKKRPEHKPIDAEQNFDKGVITPTPPQSVTVTRTPGEPVKDYSFLMGKPVRMPVLSGGRVIIPAGITVTEKTIELARKENKLVQLALRAY